MSHGAEISYLREVVVFLVAALLVVPPFLRLRASPLLGYLAVGVLIGPHGLGRLASSYSWIGYITIWDPSHVEEVAGLGVVFLMFMIGLELSAARLWQMRQAVFGLGSAQVLACGAVIGALAWLWGNAPAAAIILGASLALSSTAVVVQLLAERGEVASRLGRTCIAVLLFQDMAVAPMLVLVGVVGTATEGSHLAGELILAMVKTAAVIAVIAMAGRWLLRPLYRRIAALRSKELFVALTLLAVIGTAWLSGRLGLSMALGALLAGLVLAETEFRHQIEAEMLSFKDLLLGLFFISVGMTIDIDVAAAQWPWLGASVIGLFALKAGIIAALCLAFGLPAVVAVPVGLMLGQAGEFGFVIVGIALRDQLLPAPVSHFMLLLVALTMAATPLVALLAERIEAVLRRREAPRDVGPDAAEVGDLEGHVVIAGFGRVGHMIARFLEAQGIAYVALDTDSATVARCRARGLPVFFGDARRTELIRRIGAERAAALVATVNDSEVADRVVAQVRHDWPKLPIYVRTRDVAHSRALLARGATEVVPETVEASLQLAGRVLEGVGVPDEAVGDLIERMRLQELESLKASPDQQ